MRMCPDAQAGLPRYPELVLQRCARSAPNGQYGWRMGVGKRGSEVLIPGVRFYFLLLYAMLFFTLGYKGRSDYADEFLNTKCPSK